MTEKKIELEEVNLKAFYGENNFNFKLIKSNFPKLKIIGRDKEILIRGTEDEILLFLEKLNSILQYLEKYNTLKERDIVELLATTNLSIDNKNKKQTDVVLHGANGKLIKARTKNQKVLVDLVSKNDLVFALGPAGTGKTFTSVALAVKALKEKEVKRIILTRPAVEAGENLGFLPGDLKEKLDPYLQPLYDSLKTMISAQKLESFIENGIIEVAPLAFMRGRTLDDAFVILDEAQNTTTSQMKMFLTRMGEKAKFIITGDPSQIDLPRRQSSGLKEVESILKQVKGIGFVYLNESDVVRHKLVKDILIAYNSVKDK